jgi:tripartite-type tricarboxylate transporter receptor subunit TctC
VAYGIDATSVPFGGSGPEIQSAIAGQTPIAFSTFPPTVSHVSGGVLRGLAVTAAKRSATLPDVPTMAEAGIERQESETMQGVLVPARTPAEIVALLNREIVKAMHLDDVKAKCAELGFDPVADSPQAFALYIKQDIEKWGKVIKDANIQQIQ